MEITHKAHTVHWYECRCECHIDFVGKGKTPTEAVHDLERQIEARERMKEAQRVHARFTGMGTGQSPTDNPLNRGPTA